MQFVANGPDIPDALLHAHEDGDLVFFCGAGISAPAGLPDFKGLVDKIYTLIGDDPDDLERRAMQGKQYDVALTLLEKRFPDRIKIRRALAQALTPKRTRKDATRTHEALLTLARDRRGTLRLVTTNFDRLFHAAVRETDETFESYVAPMLPIPKRSRWNGVVFLHGLLPSTPDDAALNRLVFTSGDFGLAYLTERWAARFLSEVFKNYVVCFVGYSLSDPVLRYMMDALAADRMQGEATPQAWALVACEPGNEDKTAAEWKAKGVSPITYKSTRAHSLLHETLREWAGLYRDGVLGKESIVARYALARPSMSTPQDDFVGRMLWALADKSGLPAKRFAEFNPLPSLEWLDVAFADERFGYFDLTRFGVVPQNETNPELRFSLIRRPASSYDRASFMELVSDGAARSEWDVIMQHLADWLVRHLGDPKLILWVAKRGGRLHPSFAKMIERQLNLDFSGMSSAEADSPLAG